MNTLARYRRCGRIAIAVALTLCSTATAWAEESARSFVDMVETMTLVPAGTHDSVMLAKVTVAVDFIKRLDLPRAQLALNEALQLDPRNSQLHFLNGFVYHLQARQGDTQKGELALEGYQQALRIDPNNWIAQEFQGLAYMDMQRYDRARLAFSEVLLLTPESTRSIYGLMVASYLTGDARTACAMADQFLKVSAKPHAGFLRSSIPVYASCGSFARANWIRAALIQHEGEGPAIERIDRRLAQWQAVYDDPSMARAQAFPTAPAAPADSVWLDEDGEGTGVVEPGAALPAPPPIDDLDPGPRMLLVDVVLLSTQELVSTSKGVNLLNALTLQLGSFDNRRPAYSRVFTSDRFDGGETSTSRSITRAVTVPALSYSLNIANAASSLNEVLARPTLAATEGETSKFFSGVNLSAGVVSASPQGGVAVIPVEKSFGINLAITPRFLSQGRVQLKVEASRTALNAAADNPSVAYQIEIGETTANANVVMNMGQTLLLSGLSEKSSSRTRDGVPFLQDVPGVQYLFSQKRANDLQRSVLILVTPREPVQIAAAAPDEGDPMAERMKRLRDQFGFSDSTPANIEAVMTQLQSNTFFREFRQGDVSLERWDRMRTTGDRLKEALGFLYY